MSVERDRQFTGDDRAFPVAGTAPSVDPHFERVAIIGVGMIGGSVAAAMRRRSLASRIVGFGPAPSVEDAVGLGLIDEGAERIDDAVAGADLIVLAAPIPALPDLLRRIAPSLSPRAVVTDCASTKQSVIAAARDALGARAGRFVAAHPIAGSERSGPGAARADLFDGCKLMLCATETTDADALATVTALWVALNAEVVPIDAARHDRLYAELSHWPHAVAFALSGAVADSEFADDALRFSGGGLRDTTRIGASSAELWADILLDNRAAALASADRFQRRLDRLRQALQHADRQALVDELTHASRWRQRLNGAA
ncbi:MAG: prephenate dehydrogenase/arogenate dehydrogenase family protein [Burkholderiaceae bacterium]